MAHRKRGKRALMVCVCCLHVGFVVRFPIVGFSVYNRHIIGNPRKSLLSCEILSGPPLTFLRFIVVGNPHFIMGIRCLWGRAR